MMLDDFWVGMIYYRYKTKGGGLAMKAIIISDKEIEQFDVETWSETDARLYAADCAESVLYLYERECPHDSRPRHAINSAKNYARMIELKAPRVYIEEARRALMWAAEEAYNAAVEAILLPEPAACYAAYAAAYAAAVDEDMTRRAIEAIRSARQAAFYANKEEEQ